jgi:ATP-dependent Clp protease ATP-binding subunit ClpA
VISAVFPVSFIRQAMPRPAGEGKSGRSRVAPCEPIYASVERSAARSRRRQPVAAEPASIAGARRERDHLRPERLGENVEALRTQLEARVVGQRAAIDALTEAFQIYCSGLASPDRPLGSFLFLGPTGTGKTNLVEAFADVSFSARNAMLKIDCAEFSHSHEISRLIGSPPGYLGHQETQPYLSPANIARHQTSSSPFTLILFDEIEKANDSLWQLLLGILDKARLTLGNNKEVDLSSCFIFLTSNVGSRAVSDILAPSLGFRAGPAEGESSVERRVEKAVLWKARRTFPPEFLNRIDHKIVFHRLDRSQLAAILQLELAKIAERLERRGIAIAVEYTDRVVRRLLDEGTDPENGARPLKRVLERRVVSPLARLLASRQLVGGEAIVVDWPSDSAEVQFALAATRRLAAGAG